MFTSLRTTVKVKVILLHHLRLFAVPWTVAYQAPPCIGFSRRQVYWNGLPFSSPGDLPDPGIKSMSTSLTGVFFTTEPSELA